MVGRSALLSTQYCAFDAGDHQARARWSVLDGKSGGRGRTRGLLERANEAAVDGDSIKKGLVLVGKARVVDQDWAWGGEGC
jgi:hypothetical protein